MTPTCTYCGGQHKLSECPWKDKLESSVEDYLVSMAKLHGAEVRKVAWVGREAAPDRVVMMKVMERGVVQAPGAITLADISGGRTIWVELKRPGGKAKFPSNAHERKQDREHKRMRAVGQRVEVIDSFDGVDALFR